MIKKLTVFMIILLFTSSTLTAAKKSSYGKINFIIGKVQVKRLTGKKLNAKLNMKVYMGDKITTGKNGSAQLLLKDNVKIRIAKNSKFELKKETTKAKGRETILGLNFGKVWANIKKLKKNHKFSIETPTAVVGVRGTILVINEDNNGATIFVGEGKLSCLSKLLGTDVIVDKDFMLFISKDGKFSGPKKMSSSDKKDMMGGIPVFFRKGGFRGKENIKDELKSEINKEKRNLQKQKQFASRLKKEDLATGRTLKDPVTGKTIRVEQIFRRNTKYSFQIINLTKRHDGLTYFDLTMTYNLRLPSNLKNWGEFFSSNDNVKLKERNAKFGTKKKIKTQEDIFEWIGEYDKATDKFNDTFFVNGTPYFGDLVDDIKDTEEGTSALYSKGELTLYKDAAKTDPAGTIKISLYIINDQGKVLSEKHFNSSNDIFSIFNTTAGRILIQSDDLLYGDIDVITIPDIAFVMIQEIL